MHDAIQQAWHELTQITANYVRDFEALGASIGTIAAEGPLTDARLSVLSDDIANWLSTSPLAVGHGYLSAPGLVDGAERYLLWLERRANHTTQLRLNLDPTDDIDIYDYLRLPWFEGAREGHSVAYGPYVDYAGADELVVTFVTPVFHDGQFLGVTGADLRANAVERRLLELIQPIPAPTMVVTEHRQVLATTDPSWLPESRVPAEHLQKPVALTDQDPSSGWRLISADRIV